MQKLLFVFTFITFSFQISFSQSTRNTTDSKGTLLNNTSSPDTLRSSAILELRSTNRAFYPPRMPSDSIPKIPNPKLGAVIYDTDNKGLRIYNGLQWEMTSLPKSAMILSEFYPNDTLASAGYQYAGSVNIGQAASTPYLNKIQNISNEDAPYYNGNNSSGYSGIWGNNKLFITTPDGSIAYYDVGSDTWNTVPNPPVLASGISIVYKLILKDKYVLVASNYTVYTFSTTTNLWTTFLNPSEGNASITKVENKLVFWYKGTNTIKIFTGSRWYGLFNVSGLPSDAITLEYNGNLVFLWNENGVIKGLRISVADVGQSAPYPNTFNQFNAPASRNAYAYTVVGTKLFIWGGSNGTTYTSTGGIYDFQNNTWTTINPNGAPGIMNNVSIGEYNGRIVIYGSTEVLFTNGFQKASGGIYDLNSQSWTLINSSTASGYGPTMFVHKNYLYFWRAYQPSNIFSTRSEKYNLALNQWEDYSTDFPYYRIKIWTGNHFVEWGGSYGVNSNVLGSFSNGGSIFGSQSFTDEKIYHLYKKQ